MNFCTKCASYYQKPGTCNCYAVSQPRLWPYEIAPTTPLQYPHGGTGDVIPFVPSGTTTLAIN